MFQSFIQHKKILKVTKFKFKIICCSRVLDKNIPLWYIVTLHHPPSPLGLISLFFTKFCHSHIYNGNTKDYRFTKWFWQLKLKICNKKWYVIDSESKGVYSHENPIKFLTSSLESSLCDYSDAYVLVTGNIAVVGANNNTKVAFKNCAPFRKCRTEINETFIDEAEHINIAMPMYNLIEYSDNYSDTSGSLWQFKRDEIIGNINLTNNNSSSFKYNSNLIGNTDADGANRKKKV